MKFLEIFRFEIVYQLRRIWTWLFLIVLVFLSFLMIRDGSVSEVMYADFYLNSPFLVALTTVFGTLIWLVMAAAIAGDGAARDIASGMASLTYTVPVKKFHYLGARFLATLSLNVLLLLGVQAGILLGVYLPGVHPDLILPFRPATFFSAYAIISLPNAFAASAIQFALAVASGRAMASYFGSFLFVFMGFFVASLLLFKQSLGAILDPVGIRFIVEDIAHLWTPIEKNSRLLAMDGNVLTNRLVWFGVGTAALVTTYLIFRFAHKESASFWWWRLPFKTRPGFGRTILDSAGQSPPRVAAGNPDDIPRPRTDGAAFHVRQIIAVGRASFHSIVTSYAGLAFVVGIPVLSIAVIIDQMTAFGTPVVPVTYKVVAELTGPLSDELSRWVVVPFIIVFFAGELVWRERDFGLGEIVDTMPGSEWGPLLGKLLGLVLVLIVFTTALTVAGKIAQLLLDYQPDHFLQDLGFYFKTMFCLQLTDYLLFAVLALVIHVVVNHKYVGHLVATVAYVFIAMLAGMLGIEHKSLIYGASPSWSFNEMRGFGPTIVPWLWFKFYWFAWALLLAVLGRMFWPRGREADLRKRICISRTRLQTSTLRLVSAAAILILGTGFFIYYNTNILNPYRSSSERKQRQAEYERRFARFSSTPQPRLAAVTLHVEIQPDKREAEIDGIYRLVNNSEKPIDAIHLVTATPAAETITVTFDYAAKLTLHDQELGYQIYDLDRALQPGDSLQLNFKVVARGRGFSNHGAHPAFADNGTYFTGDGWLPMVGYQRRHELLAPSDRREYGLDARPVIASLYETEGREPAQRGGGIAFEAVVGTAKNQTAIAPGDLLKTWSTGERNYFHYATSAPIGIEWAFFSANYAIHQTDPNGVAVRVFHHPGHTAHVERLARSARESLSYYSEQFGPYPYTHMTLIEHPGASGVGMHAEPSVITHGQGYNHWIPETETGLDFPYWVMAHETAHQWTLPYALVEGLPFLSEGVASYFAIQAVKSARGEEQLRRVLKQMRQPYPYPKIRRGEPLLRALDPYLAYRRGPFALYALSEYLKGNRVNQALRTLIAKHDAPDAPLATTLDLYRELKAVAPDSTQYLLHDLFERNTYWDFTMEQAEAIQTPSGTWEVSMNVAARKTVYDSAGVVSEPSMDEWIPVGVFGNSSSGDPLADPLHLKMHRIHSGTQTIKITVPGKPFSAGIDPYHLLDWEEGTGDNVKLVRID